MTVDLAKSRKYVSAIDLSGTPRGIISQDAAEEASAVFTKAKDQAQVVGSGVFSFAKGVTPEVREAISDSALLAQLVANKRVALDADPLQWFNLYFEVLQNVGWAVQDAGFADYSTAGTAGEVHEQLLGVITAALAPGAAALSIITATVESLKKMQPGSSWLTIFNREVQKAKIARFQIGFVEQSENGDVFVSLIACLIEAKKSITQVLFFKFRKEKARFRANTGKISVNRASIIDLGPIVRGKVRAYQADYLGSIQDI